MQPIVQFGLTKAIIISTLHEAVRYFLQSLGGIIIFDPILIQGAGQIAFLIKHFWKQTPSIPLLCAKLFTLQLEAA